MIHVKNIKDTEFVEYSPKMVYWIFLVRHFTTYGLTESEDEERDDYDESSFATNENFATTKHQLLTAYHYGRHRFIAMMAKHGCGY